jgi:hypothetical protein
MLADMGRTVLCIERAVACCAVWDVLLCMKWGLLQERREQAVTCLAVL